MFASRLFQQGFRQSTIKSIVKHVAKAEIDDISKAVKAPKAKPAKKKKKSKKK